MADDRTSGLAPLLNAIAVRTQARETDLSPAIGLISDLGHLVTASTYTDVRLAQGLVAQIREQLDSEHGVYKPKNALTGSQSHSYLAGALWAVNELIAARLESLAAVPLSGHRTRRGQIKYLVLSALAAGEVLSPTAVLDSVALVDASSRLDVVTLQVVDGVPA